jgi:putative transposase
LVTPHPNFLALGHDAESRQVAYRKLVRQAVCDDDLTAIRLHLQRQYALGTDRFRAAIEVQLGRRAGPGEDRPSPEARGKCTLTRLFLKHVESAL